MILGGCTQQASHTLVVLTSGDNPPFEFHDAANNASIVGFDMDLAKLLSQRLGMDLRVEETSFDTIVAGLHGRRGDMALAALAANSERRRNIDFSAAYYHSTPTLLTLRGKAMDGVESLQNKTLGAQLGSTHDQALKTAALKIPSLKTVSFTRNSELVQELLSQRIHGVLLEESVAQGYARNMADKLQYTAFALAHMEDFAVALPKNSPLTPKVDAVLKTLQQEEALTPLIKRWFIADAIHTARAVRQ